VGINRFATDEGVAIPTLKIDPRVDQEAAENLAALRKRRDHARVKSCIAALHEACRDGSNLMPRILEAAKAYVTLGEIADVLREEFGEYREPPIF